MLLRHAWALLTLWALTSARHVRAIRTAAAPSGGPLPFGSPISDWYFVLRTTGGWLSRKPPYCGLTNDPEQPDIVLTCDKKSPPLFSLFTLVSTNGPPPALTGQPLLLVSRTYGLCGVTRQQYSPQNPGHQAGGNEAPGRSTGDAPLAAPGVVCQSRFHDGESVTTYSLMAGDLQAGQPISLDGSTAYYLLEGDRFCRVGDTPLAKNSLVCDLDSTSGAMRFLLLPAAYPYAAFTSLTNPLGTCGVKPLIAPPPYPLLCTASGRAQLGTSGQAVAAQQLRQGRHTAVQVDDAAPDGSTQMGRVLKAAAAAAAATTLAIRSSSSGGGSSSSRGSAPVSFGRAGNTAGQLLMQDAAARAHIRPGRGVGGGVSEDLTYKLTLLLQKPGTPLASGSVVAIVTYSPGLVGLPLQQCCPEAPEPHVLDCGLATGDPLPKECWFTLHKVGGRSGEVLQDGDLVLLQSRAYGRYCSVTFDDGTVLCISTYPSNATRNLFSMSLPTAAPAAAVRLF